MVNGVVTAILNIAIPLADKGHKILIVTPKNVKKEVFSYPGIEVKRLASIPATFYEEFRWTSFFSYSTYKWMKEENFQLVHFMTPFTVSYLGIKIARMLNIPVIGTFHTFITEPSYYQHMFNGIVKPTIASVWNYTNLFYNAADFVTAPSPSTLLAMQENGCTTKGQVISNGIDSSVFDNSGWKEFKEKYGLRDKVLLYFGRIAEEKNLSILVEGFRKAWQKDQEIQLLLIGDGPQRKELEGMIKKSEVQHNVIFTGSIAHDNLVKTGVFKACRLFASASKTENQPMTILEAQVNGMVCIGANSRGIPDLIKDRQNGLLFDPDDSDSIAEAIITLMTNDELLEQYREESLRMIEEHKLPRIVSIWEEVYKNLIEENRQGKFKNQDYLHVRKIIGITKDFKIDLGVFNHVFKRNDPPPSQD